jgi:hypothetical protein
MVSISLSGMRGGSNIYSPLSVALPLSPSHGSELRAPSPVFPPFIQCDFPVYPRFLKRPRLLTRLHG